MRELLKFPELGVITYTEQEMLKKLAVQIKNAKDELKENLIMKRKQLIIFLLIIVLIIIALFLVLNRGTGTYKDNDKDFAIKDTASITKVFLADKKNNTVLLERIGAGDWLLNGTYKARKSGVRLLFATFKHLAPKYPVPKSGHNNVISQLASSSIKVEIYQQVYRIELFGLQLFPHEKLTKTYYVGGATQDNMGTFMLMEDADIAFVVHLLGFRGYVAPRYSTLEKDWRDHTVFKKKLAEIQQVIMEIPAEPENSFKIVKENRDLKLINFETNEVIPTFDTLRLLNYLTAFSDIRYEALLNDMPSQKKDSIINLIPKNILTVIDAEGDSTSITTYYKPNVSRATDMEGNIYVHDLDRLYALVNDKKDFVLIQYYVFDKVLRPLSFFTSSTF